MFESTFFIFGVLVVFCAHKSSALTVPQANSVCALLPDGEKIANPVDCSKFFSCSKGKASPNSCLGNFLFDKEAQTCVPAAESSCGAVESDPCAYMSNGYYVSVANSCSEFWYCQNGIGTKSSCPNNLNFDEKDQACKYQSEYPCSESIPGDDSVNICEVVQSGIYFGVASSCKSWQKCLTNGPLEIDDCPSVYVFNVDTQACDYQENVNCRQTQGNSGGSNLNGTPCSTPGEIVAANSCSGYYVCTNGKYASGKCLNGEYFDTVSKTCVGRLDAINNCDRCEGTKMEFVNLNQDNCKGYAYCRNGKQQSTGTCANGFFSEVSGSCVNNAPNPEYPCCYIPPEEPSTEEPIETPSEKPAETPSEKPAETPSEKPAETPSDKPAQTPSDKPAQTPSDKPAETKNKKPDKTNTNPSPPGSKQD